MTPLVVLALTPNDNRETPVWLLVVAALVFIGWIVVRVVRSRRR